MELIETEQNKSIASDIVIIGAGIAGCTSAILYARYGYKVVLVERKDNIENFKVNCTHYIQPLAMEVINRLGIESDIQAAGGLKNCLNIFTPAGWLYFNETFDDNVRPHGYNIERRILDPLLRGKVMEESNIKFIKGYRLESLLYEQNELCGVQVYNFNNGMIKIKSSLIIGADGRNSKMAKLTENKPIKKVINERFSCHAYFKNVSVKTKPVSQAWMLTTGQAHAFPLNDDITLLNVFLDTEIGEAWVKNDNVEDTFINFMKELPDSPDLSAYERITDFTWAFHMHNIYRKPVAKNVAFIGDAVMALDPLAATGCAFSFKSAELLVENTKLNIKTEKLIDSLKNYSTNHLTTFQEHFDGVSAHSSKKIDFSDDSDFYNFILSNKELSTAYFNLISRLITPKEFQSSFLGL